MKDNFSVQWFSCYKRPKQVWKFPWYQSSAHLFWNSIGRISSCCCKAMVISISTKVSTCENISTPFLQNLEVVSTKSFDNMAKLQLSYDRLDYFSLWVSIDCSICEDSWVRKKYCNRTQAVLKDIFLHFMPCREIVMCNYWG